MAHYAFIDSNNVVVQVIAGVDETETQTDLDGTQVGGSTEAWEKFYEQQSWHAGLVCKRTSYNDNFRGEYAMIGGTYDSATDTFIPPPIPESDTLNETE